MLKFNNLLFQFKNIFIALVFIIVLIFSFFASQLKIDASAETLLLENDKDLLFTRDIAKKFTTANSLIVTYSTDDNLLSDKNLGKIKNLSQRLQKVEGIESITSILNVPLLESPVKPIKELLLGIPTLETQKNIDKNLVKKEFLNSPLYKKNLVSADFKTTALVINLKNDEINIKEMQGEEKKQYRDILREKNHIQILNLRKVLKLFEAENQNIKLHLGGVNMIADDMVEFVKYDLKTFGSIIILLLIAILYILFRAIKWVVIPLLISTVSIIITSGLFSIFNWEISVISSNFISLQLIMNISLIIHLIIKYQELNIIKPNFSQKQLLTETTTTMIKPSFFVVITTIAGFSSLIGSGIVPIIDFGLMMSTGIVISLLTTFILFPLILINFNKKQMVKNLHQKPAVTSKIGDIAINYKKIILSITVLLVIFSLSGALKLRVENSFIDYFKQDTEIYQGMKLIDQQLGGTTPLDIVITFKDGSDEIKNIEVSTNQELDDELDDFEDEFEESAEDKKQYWFTTSKMEKIKLIHNYLDNLEPIGKVLSLNTIGELGKILNEGEDLDGLTLALLYKELPQKYKDIILSPFVNIDHNMVRISTRIIDSQVGLNRDELLKKIDKDIKLLINPEYEEYKISNLLVIYNNMLQSLFDSQIKTISIVIIILFIMFLILFKDLTIAIVAIIVNTVPVSVIFGVMGWLNIPLDMMTITIAAISIGIAVDNTIHYIYRYKEELQNNNSVNAIINSHKSIGKAMFYTSLIIIVGFSILMLSNFIPTIYFGILTIVAMFMAILSDLLLLPVLLLLTI